MATKSETPLMHRIMLACSRAGARLFRNNVGIAIHSDGSRVRYGLCKGSSDLIGWMPVVITPDMAGKRIAVFTALEIKTGKRKPTKEQENFLSVVAEHGGIAGVVCGEDEAVNVIRGSPSGKK